jgi:hypothetical protein
MDEIVREPLGLRVLLRALRPDGAEPFLLWRASPGPELDALVEAGQVEERALLWASLLRWSEARAVAQPLGEEGWGVTLLGVRAILLDRAVHMLRPPAPGQGWTLVVAGLELRAVPELPGPEDAALQQLLSFLS